MGRRVRNLSALVAGTLAFVVGTSTAHAITALQYKCQAAIGKEAAKYINGKIKLIQKCNDANLASPGSCTAPDAAKLQKLETKLESGLAKKCSFDLGINDDNNLAAIGFPGPCDDPNPGNGFVLADLQACIRNSHDRLMSGVCGGGTNLGEACTTIVNCPDQGPGTFCRGLVPATYDPDVSGPLTGTRLKCQKEVAKNANKFLATVLKSVQKCRNGLLNCKTVNNITTCKLSGFSAQNCATVEPKTAQAITKAREKAIAAVTSKCSDPADVVALELCDPDQANGADAGTCIVDLFQDFTDNPDAGALSDLIDYQYAARGICGDNRLNQVSEECDGTADSACPGQCGAALGFFPCLCQDIPRTRVIEHANADLDNGWTGKSHDSGIVEGGGYVTDIWDCDGPSGPDTLCLVGPHCNISKLPCSPGPNATGAAAYSDSLCPTPGDFCRVSPGGATGPHCELDFKKRCKGDGDCQAIPNDRCLITAHGAPLPLASGGVSVCVVNTFTEDVVGTTDLASGAGAVRLRQNSATYTGGDQQQPCPVCGGFCSGAGGLFGPGVRNLCDSNADCAPGSFCVTESICSWGPDMDQPCRQNPPGGGPTEFFGNPSRDCRMAGNLLGVIDILFNPATTGQTTRTANINCARTGWTNKTCAGGTNEHAVCTVDSECPGGTCNDQCFCGTSETNLTPKSQQPNQCQPACLNGPDDALPCSSNADCTPPGFCHPGDCRLNGSDTDSAQEGICTVGPTQQTCSGQRFVTCANNNDCRPPNCPFCEPDETCDAAIQQCFVNPTIVRQGTPGTPDFVSAATFCIAASGSAAVDSVAGLPGPGAITQPTTRMEVGVGP